jgi:hypothetical protein
MTAPADRGGARPAGTTPPYQLQIGWDQPELLGARWWHDSLAATAPTARAQRVGSDADASRRAALIKLVAIGGSLVVGGVVIASMMRTTRTVDVEQDSLALQRAKGAAVGADNAAFAWPDAVANDHAGNALDRAALPRLHEALRPHDPALLPAYVPTLFQVFANDANRELVQRFTFVHSARMRAAFGQAQAIRELFEHAESAGRWALVIDLPGAESVAFAAGLQPLVHAVFTFDNWPHPRGVVPAHLTLAAAAYYRPLFADAAGRTRGAPAAFVLDRDRLRPYANEPQVFDNRYVAKLPPLASLQQRRVERVLYVVPAGAVATELDDLNATFAAWRQAGIEVRMLGLADVQPAKDERTASGTSPRYYWHGNPGYHWWFWNHYGWASRPGPVPAQQPPTSAFGSTWAPQRRTTMFDGVNRLGKTAVPQPAPRGSWGRSSGGFGG